MKEFKVSRTLCPKAKVKSMFKRRAISWTTINKGLRDWGTAGRVDPFIAQICKVKWQFIMQCNNSSGDGGYSRVLCGVKW